MWDEDKAGDRSGAGGGAGGGAALPGLGTAADWRGVMSGRSSGAGPGSRVSILPLSTHRRLSPIHSLRADQGQQKNTIRPNHVFSTPIASGHRIWHSYALLSAVYFDIWEYLEFLLWEAPVTWPTQLGEILATTIWIRITLYRLYLVFYTANTIPGG